MVLNLSKTMQDAIQYIKDNNGVIHRFPGGIWARAYRAEPHFGTPTIEALVSREVLYYTEWQEGRNGKFPIKAELRPWCSERPGVPNEIYPKL